MAFLTSKIQMAFECRIYRGNRKGLKREFRRKGRDEGATNVVELRGFPFALSDISPVRGAYIAQGERLCQQYGMKRDRRIGFRPALFNSLAMPFLKI